MVPGLIKRIFNAFVFVFLFVSIGILGPLELKEVSPFGWGWLEGKLGWDMTGFWFTPLWGNGACRIVNPQAAWGSAESRIVFGEVSPPNRRPYPHLWVEREGLIIDSVCPPESPLCTNRRQFASINPISLKIENQAPLYERDRKSMAWGLDYLHGLKLASQGKEGGKD